MEQSHERIKTDVLVIGGGMAGTAAAYYLSQQSSLKTILLEQFKVGHNRSSSYGEERMYRRMYSSEYLSDFQEKSLQEWRKIEAQHHCQLLREHGLLFYGEAWDEETIEGSIPGAKKVMEKNNIPFEEVNATAMSQRWPMNPRSDFIGLFETTAGMVWAAKALQVFKTEAKNNGVSIYEDAGVESLQVEDSGKIMIQTKTKRWFEASTIILAVGGWTNELLAYLNLKLELEIWSMLWGYYQVNPQYRDDYPQWFCFQKANPKIGDGGLYYGFPCHHPQQHLIKVGIDWCPPENRTQTMKDLKREPDEKLAHFLDQFLRSNWKGIEQCISLHCCPYTMTKDTLFILDKLPHFPNIILFTGGSSQAFKFAPLMGKLLSELTLNKAPSVDIVPLSIVRKAAGLKTLNH